MSIDTAPAPSEYHSPLGLLPADTVLLCPPLPSFPMRAPAGASWFLVRAVRLLQPAQASVRSQDDPPASRASRAATADLLAGVWLAKLPPADLHDGDLVLGLTAPADGNPERVDVELRIAQNDTWQIHQSWPGLHEHWPHVVAPIAEFFMRIANDNTYACAQENHQAPLSRMLMDSSSRCTTRRPLPAPDALAELLHARLVHVGTTLHCGPHRATVAASGVLTGDIAPTSRNGISTVGACASYLAGCTVNGWHIWRTKDGQLLNDLRVRRARLG